MILFVELEVRAARGAEGLTAEARAAVAEALSALCRPGGGYAGLDGRADAYYSFFAWLGLRALGAPYDREGLCAYMRASLRAARPADALCARILLAAEGRGRPRSRLALLAALLRGDSQGQYGAFLAALATGSVPRWAARIAWRRQRRLFGPAAASRLPTPRLAAGLALAALAGEFDAGVARALESRRCAGGGCASAAGAPADLLATAAARFALRVARDAGAEDAARRAEDLSFIEACWLEDGLFGPSPQAERGDAEHTFYGLLALGTCR